MGLTVRWHGSARRRGKAAMGPWALVVVAVYGVDVLTASAAARTITDTTFHFTVRVPEGYIDVPSVGDGLHSFATSDPADGLPDGTVVIQRLHGTIGREHMSLKSTGLADAHFLPGKWKTYDIDVVAAHIRQGDIRLSLVGAQIPLKHEAIQVMVLVPAAREAEAPGILQTFLAGLEGESSWDSAAAAPLTEAERGKLVGSGLGTMVGIVGALGILGVLVYVWYAGNRKPRGG